MRRRIGQVAEYQHADIVLGELLLTLLLVVVHSGAVVVADLVLRNVLLQEINLGRSHMDLMASNLHHHA